MKEFLSREGHTFETKYIEDDATAFDELVALGARAVPVTLIDKQVVIGFDQTKLRAALAASAGGS